MKIGKLLILFAILSIAFAGCDEDEDPGNIMLPRADFAYTPSTPREGEEILFYADPEENSGDIVSWHWSFGDPEGSTSTKRNPYFTYAAAGDYEVVLRVMNAAGNSMEVSRTVTVTPPPPDEFPANIAWSFTSNNTVANINDGSSAPVIGDDGTIYYVESRAGAGSSVLAVTDGGESATLKWVSNAFGGELPNAPSIGPDGNIFINAWVDDRAISKISAADGSILWSGAIGTDVSNNTPAVDSQGNTYHGSRAQGANGGVFSWSPEGEKRWEITGVGAFYAAPVISADESTVYFLNTNEGKIWAVNAADGTQKWTEPVGLDAGIHGSSLSMGADGTIYFTTNTHVAAVTDEGETGALKWAVEVNDASNSGVVIGPDGTLYTGSVGGLLAMNPADGSVLWTYDAEIRESVPAVDMNGNIYVGTTSGLLLIVSPEGELLKELQLGDDVVNSPTIMEDGTVYVEATDKLTIKLYKILVENSGVADSPWPMKGKNVKNTALMN
ncbi:PQQ-binding-like beta-propeller repeat protein [Cesiribacter sp. SM1]|uniref:outer membrane protein assembly factor BamB family protein n=1 Tax=Cesiribacter sp. SM1 TaxID=2861196 RepID=UPI001CD7155A|nr:PQQ-binding-like beta-propeller repeat protein [Cesiribacter sp. SM1]